MGEKIMDVSETGDFVIMFQNGDFLEEVICKGWKPLKILIS